MLYRRLVTRKLNEKILKKAQVRFPSEPGESVDLEGNVYETDNKNWPEQVGYVVGYEQALADIKAECEMRMRLPFAAESEFEPQYYEECGMNAAYKHVIDFMDKELK